MYLILKFVNTINTILRCNYESRFFILISPFAILSLLKFLIFSLQVLKNVISFNFIFNLCINNKLHLLFFLEKIWL